MIKLSIFSRFGFDLTKLKSYEDTYEESDNSMDKIMGLLKYLPPSSPTSSYILGTLCLS